LQTRACAEGLAEKIQPIAINISQTVTHVQDLGVQFSPTITECVMSNIAKPIAIPGCLSKVIGPVISEVSTIALQLKNDFRKYEQENANFLSQIQQCEAQLRDTVASVGTLVRGVRKCVTKRRGGVSSSN
jgi:hypothetical protein